MAMINLDRSEPGPAVGTGPPARAWAGHNDLSYAFLAKYGSLSPPPRMPALVIDATLNSVGGISYSAAHGDPELVERGRRTLGPVR